ncbi:hypothetical protein PoB_007559800 [Plakobranchus ocellatus]|uniref:Uncharacterized protein n=1 Tax=Plakobranchus ocellatus TaxID=259542 RepID=A0AAV4DXK7_9GAST|nr:hypothetical protein PoB_007559800 [Plakobranchus ocellatus]
MPADELMALEQTQVCSPDTQARHLYISRVQSLTSFLGFRTPLQNLSRMPNGQFIIRKTVWPWPCCYRNHSRGEKMMVNSFSLPSYSIWHPVAFKTAANICGSVYNDHPCQVNTVH